MGKGSSILATLALVVGLGVGSFVIYDNFFVITPDVPPENQWDDTTGGSYYVPSGYTWSTLSAININFNVSSGQTVHFLFIAIVNFDDSSTPSSSVEMKFMVDGIIWFYPSLYVRRYNLDSTEGYRMSVSLQHYNTTMTPGSYSITVAYRGEATTDRVTDASLFIQTFK